MNEEVKALLIEGKRKIEREGWVKGNYACDDGYCMVGALGEQNGCSAKIEAAKWILWNQVNQHVYTSVYRFNDAEETTKADVLDVYTRAIEACE